MRLPPLVRSGLALTLAICLLSACADHKTESFADKVRKATEEANFTGPALWRFNDDDTTIYLFGTVHTLRPETRWEVPEIHDALLSADAIYFEADTVSTAAQNDINEVITELGLFTDGRTLQDVLPDEAEREFEETIDILGVSSQAFYNFRPWFASLQLSSIHLGNRNFNGDLGVESVIGADARAREVPIRYLETGAYQLGLLASVPEEEQINLLVQTAQQIEDDPDFLETLIAKWAIGDVAALGELIAKDDVFGSGEVYNLMIRTRNANWSSQLKTLLDEEAGTFFVAVGAAHLAGEDSVQNLLATNDIIARRENPLKTR